MLMVARFSGRLVVLDESTDEFLKTLALLGGYCTVEQAQTLGVAKSPTRVLTHLRGLERGGFLRKLAVYPVVYQVTKSVARLLATDLRARRPHPVEAVQNRLLAVNFYLEALHWPSEFVFDHEEKIAAFQAFDCPLGALPQRSGRPYLWEDFVLKLQDGRLCAAIVDHGHQSAFLQLRGLAKRFLASLECLRDRFQLLIVVGSQVRYRQYSRLGRHPNLQKLSQGRFAISVSLYRVRKPAPLIRPLSSPDGEPSEKTSEGRNLE